MPTNVYAQTTLPAPRLLIVTYGGGIDVNRIYPDGTPHLSPLSASKLYSGYQPLAGLINSFSVIGNLHNTTASYPCDFIGGGHGGAAASLFTCGMVYSKESNGNLPLAGPSFDQVVGQSLYASRGTMACLVLGTPDGNDNVESWGFPYNRYTSYRKDSVTGKIESAPLILNPKAAFDAVMAATTPPYVPPVAGGNPVKTLVDFVLADAKDLRRKISKNDKLTLDRYLANVTDLQKSISMTQPNPNPTPAPTCNGSAPTVPATLGWDKHPTTVDQMNEIIKLAFQCDRTRVINYAMGQCQSVINFNRFGLKNADGSSVMDRDHHNITHTNENPAEATVKVNSLHSIVKWYNQKFANLLNSLKSTPDPVFGGTLLDNTIVLWMSEFSNGWAHYGNHLPVVIAGGGAGLLRNQGKYMAFTDKRLVFTCRPEHGQLYSNQVEYQIYPSGLNTNEWLGHTVSDLYLTIMQKMGVKVNGSLITKFGDSSGTIAI